MALPRRAITIAALVSCAFIAGCGEEKTPQTSAPSTRFSVPTETADPSSRSTEKPVADERAADIPKDAQKATVRRIVDGDTLELAAVAPGPALSSTQQVDVRLLEIDTPETKHPSKPVQCYGEQATSHLSELVPPGSTVWVQRDAELRDQYGRYLLYLWTAEGQFVNLKMVTSGYAAAKLYEPNDKHWPEISAAEQQARQSEAGLWGACAYFGEPVETTTPEPETQPAPPPQEEDNDTYLFPPPPPDKDCGGISARSFRVRPGDPHRFDSDGDGIGCEG